MIRPISHDRAATQRAEPRARGRLEARLRAGMRGEVRFDAFTRGLYSTDASIYQVRPRGVVFLESAEDVRRAVELAGEHDASVVVRGAGTSQSGQSIGRGVILDTSRALNAVLDFDPAARRVVVEPGIVLDRLNDVLRPHGLFFPIDVATASRATLGGMAGNNSAGSRSVRYGHMVEHVRGVDTVLADGRRAWFGRDAAGPTPAGGPASGPVPVGHAPAPASLEADLRTLHAREADELARRIPDVPRHVAGYALHRLGRPGAGLSDLLVGSEGTLALFTALELDLQPIPSVRALGVCRFDGTEKALAAVPAIVALEPTAVELFDATVLGLAARMRSYEEVLRQLGEDGRRPPRDLLVVEFAGDDPDRVAASLRALESAMGGIAVGVARAESAALQGRIWALRKAGLNISMSQPAARKPLAFIEDCAIPLHRLPEWYRRLTAIIDRHATHAVWYAHASVGCLHVRPALNLRDGDDVARMREIASEAFALAGALGGSHSGEHGDGWIRSEFLEPMLGTRLVSAFGEIKRRFDPGDRLNPGKIVDPPRMNDPALLRARHGLEARKLPTALDWGKWGGFAGAVDMCNNNGTCLKRSPGVMCPSFRATSDERHSTRGRANALRLALSGQLGNDPWTSPALYEAMDLCLGCKACRRECPTGVDMARMKIDYLRRVRADRPPSARDMALAYLPRYAPLAARLAPLVNLRNRVPALARLGERMIGLAADRPLPHWSSRPFRRPSGRTRDPPRARGPERRSSEHTPPAPGRVALFVDTFTRYFEPEIARAAVRVLSRAGVARRGGVRARTSAVLRTHVPQRGARRGGAHRAYSHGPRPRPLRRARPPGRGAGTVLPAHPARRNARTASRRHRRRRRRRRQAAHRMARRVGRAGTARPRPAARAAHPRPRPLPREGVRRRRPHARHPPRHPGTRRRADPRRLLRHGRLVRLRIRARGHLPPRRRTRTPPDRPHPRRRRVARRQRHQLPPPGRGPCRRPRPPRRHRPRRRPDGASA